MKPVLLAFCAIGAPCVARDLRYWPDAEHDPPGSTDWASWSIVPMNVAAAIHNLAAKDESEDPTLESVRVAFAEFCLERLKPIKTDSLARRSNAGEPSASGTGLVEPRACWRECLIRAVRELRVNPKGKGHHTLNHVRQHDPDEHVRKAAAEAYTELRQRSAADLRRSPRSMLLAAFWWLRQAHLLGLGIAPDSAGAQRTRNYERRRTTEPALRPSV
ncbi:MAG: hypothetical protein JNK53_08060 [Phycisphaerae bacterium]|nr:hypothetical protein [Phycisphaerae bacterium]